MSPLRAPTVVFHLGAHKTGTSLLQKYMRDNSAELRRRHVYYLSRGSMNDYVGWGGRLLADSRPLARKIRRSLLVPWVRLLVASHENTLGRPFRGGGAHLYPDAPAVIDALARLLAPYRATILWSIRPQAELLESYYLQTIHEGRHHSFADWLARLDLDALSWLPVADKLFGAFGRDHVEVVDFGLIRQGQEAYIRHFLSRIQPGYDADVRYAPMRNASISGRGLRMALAANPHLRTGEERKLMRVFLQKHFSNARYPRPELLTDEQRGWLHDRYDGEYARLVGHPRTDDAPQAVTETR